MGEMDVGGVCFNGRGSDKGPQKFDWRGSDPKEDGVREDPWEPGEILKRESSKKFVLKTERNYNNYFTSGFAWD